LQGVLGVNRESQKPDADTVQALNALANELLPNERKSLNAILSTAMQNSAFLSFRFSLRGSGLMISTVSHAIGADLRCEGDVLKSCIKQALSAGRFAVPVRSPRPRRNCPGIHAHRKK
jgi:hypothetical protein